MHSITPILRRLSRRAAAAPGDTDAWLDADESFALWGAVLDGALPELELGALLASLAIAGESPDELLGLHRALAARRPGSRPRPRGAPCRFRSTGSFPGEAAFSVLLALFLRRFDVPVVLHGPLDSPEGPSAPVLLRELGVMPSATLARGGARPSRVRHCPSCRCSCSRRRWATCSRFARGWVYTNSAHLAAQAMDPGAMGAVRLAMSVPGTPSERLAELLAATGGEALLLSWPAGMPRRQPRLPAAHLRCCPAARSRSSSRPKASSARRMPGLAAPRRNSCRGCARSSSAGRRRRCRSSTSPRHACTPPGPLPTSPRRRRSWPCSPGDWPPEDHLTHY